MPEGLVPIVEAHRGFVHVVLPDGLQTVAVLRLVQPHRRNAIMADLQADRVFRLVAQQIGQPRMAGMDAQHDSAVRLLKLIAVDGIVEEVREIRPEVQVIVICVSQRVEQPVASIVPEFRGEAVSI